MNTILESKLLEVDFNEVQRRLSQTSLIKCSELLGNVDDVFLTRNHHYRYIDDWTFLHPLDFKVGRSYTLAITRPDLIFVQVMLRGSYTRHAMEYVGAVTAATVQISNTPYSISDILAGETLRGALIVIRREHFLKKYSINAAYIPERYRRLLLSRDGLSEPMQLSCSPSVLRAVEQILARKFEEPIRSVYLQAKVTEVLCSIAVQLGSASSHRVRGEVTQVRTDIIAIAAEIYRREYNNPPTIDQLSVRVGINRNDLAKGFKSEYGLTPYAYLQCVRMEQAQTLLLENALSISEVARRVGFEGYRSLARAYRKHFGRALARLRGASSGI